MKIKEIIKRILFYISVPKCVCCKERLDYEDRGLCKRCLMIYEEHKKRNCPRCSKKLSECFCTYDKLDAHGIKNLVKLFRYSKSDESLPSNYLIYSLKQDNRDDVIDLLSDELSESIRKHIMIDPEKIILTNVPRRNKAIIKFGYDHSKVLAREVSRKLGVEYQELLLSKSKKPQKSVYGQARLENAVFDYDVDDDYSLKGRTVIIIDDIITTGASMMKCASLIKGLGARRVIGACLGTAYKEPYVDFEHSAYE